MKHIPSNDRHVVILDRGEELMEALTNFAKEHGLTSAWVSGLGGASELTIGFYDLETKEYLWKEYDTPLEVLNLTGNLSLVDGQPFWHIHGTFSGTDYKCIGGHVQKMTVGLTGEIYITPLSGKTSREYDEATGLKLICPAE